MTRYLNIPQETGGSCAGQLTTGGEYELESLRLVLLGIAVAVSGFLLSIKTRR